MGLDKKADALLSLMPEVAVIPKCSEKSVVMLQGRGYKTLWFGSNPQKGVGVICRKELSIRALMPPEQHWIIPIEVTAPIPFTLIAVWTCPSRESGERYIVLVYQALMTHPEWFSGGPVIVAGDFNSNKIWDGKRKVNHSAVVRILQERGLVSTYHEYFGEPQGEESRFTLFMRRHQKEHFHIDYVFIPQGWLPRLKKVVVGGYEKWSKLSDHSPMLVELCDAQGC